MTIMSTTENQALTPSGFIIYFCTITCRLVYSCYKTPWWWSQEWTKHVGEE